MTTGLTGRQIRDKTVDGDDLKDSVTINPSGAAGGGLYVRGVDGYLLSASAGAGTVALSGSITLSGDLFVESIDPLVEVTGSLSVTGGITGSLTCLPDGSAYLRAGSGISVVSGSDGSVTVSATGGGGGGGGSLDLTSVVVNPSSSLAGGFYVLGADGYLLSASAGTGAVTISGSLTFLGGMTVEAVDPLVEVTGSLSVTGGISGSLTRLADGSTYLRAGSGISIVSGSDGSVTVSSTGSMPDLSYILLNNAGPVFENERILTAGTGITITDAGPRGSVTISAPGAGGAVPATDGNHVYVYALDDAAGGTIANTGATSGGDLVVAGAPIFQSGRLSRSGRSILWPATASSDRAAGDVSSISGTGLTLEAFVSVLGVPHTFGVVLCVYTAGGDNVIINTHSTNGFYAQVLVGGSYANTYSTPVPVQYGRPTHVAMTWDLSTIRLYVDGFLRASAGCTLTPPAWDRISIANYGPTANSAFFGNIMQARVSDVARSSDYIMAAAEAAFKV